MIGEWYKKPCCLTPTFVAKPVPDGAGVLLRAKRGEIAGRCFGEAGQPAGEVEQLGRSEGADEGGQIGGEERHAALDVVGERLFCAVEGDGHFAGAEDALEFGGSEFAALGGGGLDGDDHERGAVQDGAQGYA
jgi:hypothetical protein